MADDAGESQGTLSSSAVALSLLQEGTIWYRPTDEEAEIDQALLYLEERQGAWRRIRWKGGAGSCTPCRSST